MSEMVLNKPLGIWKRKTSYLSSLLIIQILVSSKSVEWLLFDEKSGCEWVIYNVVTYPFLNLALTHTLSGKCPNTGFFSDMYFPVVNPNAGKYGPEKTTYLDTFHAVMGVCIPGQKLRSALFLRHFIMIKKQ